MKTCPKCHGVGSEEAYLDEVWQEEMDTRCSTHGLFLTSGEGDPCDILVGRLLDDDEIGIIFDDPASDDRYTFVFGDGTVVVINETGTSTYQGEDIDRWADDEKYGKRIAWEDIPKRIAQRIHKEV